MTVSHIAKPQSDPRCILALPGNMRLPDKCPVGYSRLPHCNGASEHHTNQKKYLFPCACICIFMHEHMIPRAIAIDRARAGTGPLRTRTQRSCSCASILRVNIYGMTCLAHTMFMQNIRRYQHREPLSSESLATRLNGGADSDFRSL